MALSALADDHAATSVSTLDFKNQFVASGIVPEVVAALDPSVSFYASYKAGDDDHDELLVPGSSLSVSEATMPFEFSVENLNNATNITAQTRFLIYLLDADAPARSDPTARNLRHYLAGNYTQTGQHSTVLPTAQLLAVPNGQFRPLTPFTNPNPSPGTGVHRFIYALYTQPARFNSAGFESVGMEAETQNWNLSRWRAQLGLGPAIGATFFTIDTSSNTTGTSGGRTNSTAGSSSAGTVSPPLGFGFMSFLMALVLFRM
ncbi:PEBP-like protein [Parathielavia appendiculata]|uniref:PEBP-like protein n=1 Tax=Parathielavia appendiculata TaxID=2587402 RepID=A0AAN6Z016_9PEZI|nr:PEBP-like protein [Parathielavia appendiculata]